MQGGGPMYWEPDRGCMDREELEQLQFERLQSTLNRIYSHVPFYRKRFVSLGGLPEDIASLADFSRLPFTAKEDLRESYPYGLFAVPLREVVRIHASSGTTGASTVVGYTRNDIRIWRNLTAPALISTPSYAMLVAETIREQGIPLAALSLKYGLFGAEPWSEQMRQEIQEKLRIVATDNYGLSEIIGPGVSGECREQNGLHINEDHFLVEVVAPETHRPLPDGETGALVTTSLNKEH